MKYILITLFITSSLLAMQQTQSNNECFFAHAKFRALIKSCQQTENSRATSYNAVMDECIRHYYREFKNDCDKEIQRK